MLDISTLSTQFSSRSGIVRAVDIVDLSIRNGERLGLIGETGCGKTVLGMSVVRLLPSSATTTGRVRYKGREISDCSEDTMRSIRGKEISFILQNPTTSLNPVMRVGDQIAESVVKHQGVSRKTAYTKALSLMESVNFQDAETRALRYPHELSGGMKQKVMIAMGLAGDPSLIIADEPTKSLDRTNKNEILDVMRSITVDKSMIMITHDLPAAGKICDRIAVMYGGEIVEEGPAETVLTSPMHPYTSAFIQAHPTKGCRPIPGISPSLIAPPEGCRFHPRCTEASDECRIKHPEMGAATHGGMVRCHCH
ncbi:MAG TPA: ABC transporter ATP-binding protein [Methanospirillum sp.]|nr:ABC transporter ATP-binding protein [Methanospirillum sp.]